MSQDCSLLHLGQNSYSLPFSMILLLDFPLPSGNLTQPWNYIMVNSHSYVSLLEGSSLVSVRSLGRTNDSLRDSHFAGYWTRPCSSTQFFFFTSLLSCVQFLFFFLVHISYITGWNQRAFGSNPYFFVQAFNPNFGWQNLIVCLINPHIVWNVWKHPQVVW